MNKNWDDKASVEKRITSYAQLTDQINMQNDHPTPDVRSLINWCLGTDMMPEVNKHT